MVKKTNAEKAVADSGMERAVSNITCSRFSSKGWKKVSAYLPEEIELMIRVNGQELVTISCTPVKLNLLVLGFLYSEGIITGIDDIAFIRLCEEEPLADVRLSDSGRSLPTRRRITSGCGAGVTFASQAERVNSDLLVTPADILALMERFRKSMVLYRISGSVHTSALSDTRRLITTAEDIGRHNTLDKIQGECLLRSIKTEGRLLLTTGRVSAGMLLKAARMVIPVVVSQRLPTKSAVSLAQQLNITLVGRARAGRLSVFAHPERLSGVRNE